MIKSIALLLLLSLFSCEEPTEKIELPLNTVLVCVGGEYQVLTRLGYSIGVNPTTLSLKDTVRFYGFGSNYPYLVTKIKYYSIEKAQNTYVNIAPSNAKQAYAITLEKLEQ